MIPHLISITNCQLLIPTLPVSSITTFVSCQYLPASRQQLTVLSIYSTLHASLKRMCWLHGSEALGLIRPVTVTVTTALIMYSLLLNQCCIIELNSGALSSIRQVEQMSSSLTLTNCWQPLCIYLSLTHTNEQQNHMSTPLCWPGFLSAELCLFQKADRLPSYVSYTHCSPAVC